MLTPETQPDHYPEKPPTGTPVLFWPKGKVDYSATPHVGFIHKGHDLGVADIHVLPEGDGAVMFFDGVFHIGDRRVLDSYGNISTAADRRGVWEPSPFVKDYFERRIKELGVASKKRPQ